VTDAARIDDEGEATKSFDSRQPVQFSDRQLMIIGALSERGGAFDYAAMLRGAIMARGMTDNPLCFVLAAHGIRELMEKLPSSFSVPTGDPGLKEQIRVLSGTWEKVRAHEQWSEVDNWTGLCAGPLANLVKQLKPFFERFSADFPTRKRKIAVFFTEADPKKTPLPEEVSRARVDAWAGLWDFFDGLSHHRRASDEFDLQLDRLESFLVDLLAPETIKDRATINALIAKGEGR
jgi:hypothetical protein